MAKLLGYTYKELEEVCNGRSTVIGNNTLATPVDGEIIQIYLHGTKIVELYFDGSIAFSLAGYPTVTTRNRINSFLPPGYQVFQRKNIQQLMRPTLYDTLETIEIDYYTWYATHTNNPKPARMVLDRSK